MSRVGKKPIIIPAGVAVALKGREVSVKGPKGELTREIHPDISVSVKDNAMELLPSRATKKSGALWGLSRTLLSNMVIGVSDGFEKKLEFEGIGFRANLEGDTIVFALGFSHPVRFPAPKGIAFKIEKNVITVSGADKEAVGETAARIRQLKPPEPYKGKGIRYQGEVIRRKAGKKAVAGG